MNNDISLTIVFLSQLTYIDYNELVISEGKDRYERNKAAGKVI